MSLKKWEMLEHYISERLKVLDPHARPSKCSGGSTESYDLHTDCGLAIEAKQRATDSVTIKKEHWEHLTNEIPLHSENIPVLALENKEGKRWAVLELDDFLDIFIRLKTLEAHEEM